jgi:hypothetical protein
MNTATFSQVRKAFEDETVFNARPEQLRAYLKTLTGTPLFNEAIKHQVGVMAQAISQVQLSRLIEKVNRQNMIVAGIALLLAVAQIFLVILRHN